MVIRIPKDTVPTNLMVHAGMRECGRIFDRNMGSFGLIFQNTLHIRYAVYMKVFPGEQAIFTGHSQLESIHLHCLCQMLLQIWKRCIPREKLFAGRSVIMQARKYHCRSVHHHKDT